MVVNGSRAGAEQTGHAVRPQGHAVDAQLVQRASVGTQKFAVGVDHQNAFEQSANEFHTAVKVQAQLVVEVVRQPMVFNHARRHAHQTHGVLVIAAVVAGDVEHAQHLAARIKNRHRRTGQKTVGVHEVLAAVNQRGRFFKKRRADGVGALGMLGPIFTGGQSDLVSAR